MRRSVFLPKLSRLLVFTALTAFAAGCATAPTVPGEEPPKAGQPSKDAEIKPPPASPPTGPEAKPASSAPPQAKAAKREAPSFPSPALAYKLTLPATTSNWSRKIIYSDTVWSGDILITQPITVTKTGSLTITEGATIYFDMPTAEDDKETPWVTVRGKLFIRGTAENPVRMTSVFLRHYGTQDIVNAVAAKEVAVDYAIFERSGWGMHIHDTPTEVRGATFRDNYGGARFKSEKISFTGCVFKNNRIGTRLLNSSGTNFTGNVFTGNLTGIFFREGIKTPTIEHNDFDNYEYDIKLGENQTLNIEIGTNWWKNATRADLEEFIYDGKDSEGVGTIYTAPPSDKTFTPEQP